jgi:colicin import membrane protein
MLLETNDVEITAVPEVQEAEAAVNALVTLADSYAVTTVVAYEAGADDLKRVKAAQKQLEELRTGMTGPLNASLKRINDFFRAPTQRLQNAEGKIKRALLAFSQEQERIRREEQAKRDAEARKEQERLAKLAAKAEAAGKVEKAERLELQAATIVAPVVQMEQPRVTGLATREVWHGECVDLMALVQAIAAGKAPLALVAANDKVIGQQARSLKTDFAVPGIRVWSTQEMASRSA